MPTRRICLWSGPRNVSTALLYAFAQRSDTRVVDEPFYAHYLRVSGAEHPAREAVMASQNQNGEQVVRDLVLGPCDRAVLFIKQMAHHFVDIDYGFLSRTLNVLLIREPSEMLRSFDRVIPRPGLGDVGLARQWEHNEQFQSLGQQPLVIDSRELLLDPPVVLTELCQRLGLEFDPAMLHWEKGGRPEDGVWAPHWYKSVHRSTGFGPYRAKTNSMPKYLESVLEECQPFYDKLYRHALRSRG